MRMPSLLLSSSPPWFRLPLLPAHRTTPGSAAGPRPLNLAISNGLNQRASRGSAGGPVTSVHMATITQKLAVCITITRRSTRILEIGDWRLDGRSASTATGGLVGAARVEPQTVWMLLCITLTQPSGRINKFMEHRTDYCPVYSCTPISDPFSCIFQLLGEFTLASSQQQSCLIIQTHIQGIQACLPISHCISWHLQCLFRSIRPLLTHLHNSKQGLLSHVQTVPCLEHTNRE